MLPRMHRLVWWIKNKKMKKKKSIRSDLSEIVLSELFTILKYLNLIYNHSSFKLLRPYITRTYLQRCSTRVVKRSGTLIFGPTRFRNRTPMRYGSVQIGQVTDVSLKEFTPMNWTYIGRANSTRDEASNTKSANEIWITYVHFYFSIISEFWKFFDNLSWTTSTQVAELKVYRAANFVHQIPPWLVDHVTHTLGCKTFDPWLLEIGAWPNTPYRKIPYEISWK